MPCLCKEGAFKYPPLSGIFQWHRNLQHLCAQEQELRRIRIAQAQGECANARISEKDDSAEGFKFKDGLL